MKVLFISDIHGSFYYLRKVMDEYEKQEMDKIVILGDVLYHGPRNQLPKGYDCQAVLKLLNGYKEDIIAVRGNCDAEVDQMVLEFDVMADYKKVNLNGIDFFLTHGHLYEGIPDMAKDCVFAYGHIHKAVACKQDGQYVINPSSISLSKEGVNSYGVLENDIFTIYDLDGTIVKTIQFL